jgi:hypothetical protein
MLGDLPHHTVHPQTRQQWREWLTTHDAQADGVWLITNKKYTGKSRFGSPG